MLPTDQQKWRHPQVNVNVYRRKDEILIITITSTYLLFFQRRLSMSQYYFKMISNLFPTDFSICVWFISDKMPNATQITNLKKSAHWTVNHITLDCKSVFSYFIIKHVSLGFYLRPLLLLIRFYNYYFLNIVFFIFLHVLHHSYSYTFYFLYFIFFIFFYKVCFFQILYLRHSSPIQYFILSVILL